MNSVQTPTEQVAQQTPPMDTLFDEMLEEKSFVQPEQPVEMPTLPEVALETQQPPQPAPVAEKPLDNDRVRYEYFQSQAAKEKSRNEKLVAELEYLKQQVRAAPQEPEPVKEELPPAPTPPKRPEPLQYYSREEALADPSSASAKYDAEVKKWQGDSIVHMNEMLEYRDKISKIQNEKEAKLRAEAEERHNQQEAYNQQLRQVSEFVMEKGGDEQIFQTFVEQTSSPDFITMDNLWTLFCLNNNIPQTAKPAGQAPAQPTTPPPSPVFQQSQKASFVPPPMGVMPNAVNEGRTADPVKDFVDWAKAYNEKTSKF